MTKIFKKATALFLAATMAITPLTVRADEPAVPFAATIATATATAEHFMEALDIPGMTVAFVDITSGFTWTQGFGYANAETGALVDEYTLFPIGSVAKTFTAVALMQLVEQGILDLDEPIVTYLPEFSMLPHPSHGGNYRNITTRMLLTHTSGIHEFMDDGGVFARDTGMNRYIMNELVPLLTNMHMQNEELNRITYNNTGYALLGTLLASLMGAENYFDGFVNFTQENIFDVAGMPNSTFDKNFSAPNFALPHDNATTLAAQRIYASVTASGGMVSNAVDMARFMHIILNGGAYDGDENTRILSAESVAEMARVQDMGVAFPSALQMGLGIYHVTLPDGTVLVGHDGILQHVTMMILDFDNGIGVFVCGNSLTAAGASTPLAMAIWQTAVYEKTGAPPATVDVQIGTPFTNLQEIAGWYTEIGEIALGEDGLLHIVAFPGVPMPITLTPMENGMFDSMLGEVHFEKHGGIVALFAGTAMISERLVLTPVGNLFDAWLGRYYLATPTGETVEIRLGVTAQGYLYFEIQGMKFMLNAVDGYTSYAAGRGRGLGGVSHLSVDADGVITMHESGFVTVMHPAPEPYEVSAPNELRFVIGENTFTFNSEQHSLAHAPFLCLEYGRTMMELSDISAIFNLPVSHNEEGNFVMFGGLDRTIPIGVTLPGGFGMVQIVDGYVFVPLAYIASTFGLETRWDDAYRAVYVTWQ